MRNGIPESDRTFVVVPAIVDSEARMRLLFHDLEVRFLANQDANLFFALLSDFTDADAQHQPGDEALLQTAEARVAELNERHGAGRFFLFHRERRWNPSEGRWMGWERKRGKLAEFNRLLRGAEDTSFIVRLGRPFDPALDQVRRSRSTLTRNCRWTPRDGWSARCRTRSTVLASTRSCGVSPKGTASCSRASA